jgi:hypothetical protein
LITINKQAGEKSLEKLLEISPSMKSEKNICEMFSLVYWMEEMHYKAFSN